MQNTGGDYLNYISNIIEIFATMTEVWVCMCFALTVLCKKVDFKDNIIKIVCGALMYTIIITLCNGVQTVSNYITFLTVLLLSLINLALTKKDWIYCFVVSTIFVIFQAVIEMIIISAVSVAVNDPDYIFNVITAYEIARIVLIFVVKALIIAVYFAIKNILLKINISVLKKPSFVAITVAGLIITLKMMSIIISNEMTELKIGVSILFIAFIVTMTLIVYLFDKLLKEQIQNEKQNFLAIKNNLLESNLKNLNRLYADNSKNFHEFKHHLNVLAALLKNQQFDKMEKYFSEININDSYNAEFITGNEILDIVLNVENAELKNKCIKFNVVADIPQKLGIDDSDLCSMLLNIIDNAAEACEKETDKSISLTIKSKGNMLILSSTNYCSVNPIDNEFATFKAGNHGWGIKIINDIVEKYEGTLEHSYENNKYTIDVFLIQKFI